MKKRRGIVVFMASMMLVPYFTMGSLSVEAEAATFYDINQDNVFLNQETNYTCTLCSNTMMIRRALLISGKSDWNTLTESVARADMWLEGAGMYYSYTCRGIRASCEKFKGDVVKECKELLKVHPEGIVIYDYSYPHAILLTDYTDGKIYCSEPGLSKVIGRVPVDQSLITVESADCYWCVTTPLPWLTPTVPLNNSSTIDQTKIMAGNKVNLKAAATGGSKKYEYEYAVLEPDYSYWNVLKNYSTSTTCSFMPYSAGKYKLRVTVRDDAGSKTEKIFDLTVIPSDLTNTSTISKSSVDVGTKVTIKGSATGGSKSYKYEYSVKPAGSMSWTVLREMSSSESVEYIAKPAGNCQFKVTVQDTNGIKMDKVLNLTVKDTPLANRSGLSNPIMVLGNGITITGSAVGGSGSYSYSFFYKKATSSNYQKLNKKNESDNYVVFKPTAIANYNIRVTVMDSYGNTSDKNFTVSVKKAALANRSTVSSTKVSLGQTVKLAALSTGGDPGHEYAYGYALNKEDALKNAEYTTEKTKTFKPTKEGKYYFRVAVKDSSGAKVVRTFEVEVVSGVKNTSTVSSTSVKVGTSVTVNGSATGGSGKYNYQILLKKPGAAEWTTVRAYGTRSTLTTKPSIKGKYLIKVNVKDTETNAVSSKIFTVTAS